MSLLTPWAGFFLLIGVVPPLLLLYFLKLRRRTLPISSTMLWFSSIADLQANSPFQRLRRNILLLLQLIVLLLLILAIMQPRLEGQRGAGGRTVLLIDRSGSMTATDGTPSGGTRLSHARDLARKAIDRLHPGGLFASGDGETMVVAFGETAEIIQPFTDSRAQLLSAIDRIEPTHGRSQLGEALQLARVYSINTDPDNPDTPQVVPAHLELFSDGRLSDIDDQVLRGETLEFHRIGEDAPSNLAVLQLAADRPWDAPSAIEVFASLGNFTAESQLVDVQLTVDGMARSVQEIQIPESKDGMPGRRSLVFAPFELARGAVIEVALIGEDDMATDDTAVLVVPPPRRLKIALVNENRLLLARLLGGLLLEKLEIFTLAQWEARDLIANWDVVVFDAVSPAAMSSIPSLTFGAVTQTDQLRAYGVQEESQIAFQSKSEHPIMRHVNIDSLFIQKSTAIQPSDSVEVLLEGSRTPLIMSWEELGVPHVHVAFDPIHSTWPYEPGFVAFLFNTIDWLGHSDSALVQQQVVPGGTLVFDVPPGEGAVRLVRPDGSTRELSPQSQSRVTWSPVDLSGLHVIELGDETGQVRRRSVRFPSESESEIRPLDSITLGQEEVTAARGGSRGYVPMWPWAIVAGLMMLMLEWWIWSSRVGGRRDMGSSVVGTPAAS